MSEQRRIVPLDEPKNSNGTQELDVKVKSSYEREMAIYENELSLYKRASAYKMSDRFAGFLVVFANFWIVFFTSFISILVICRSATLLDAVMNYIAIGVITEVDNILFSVS